MRGSNDDYIIHGQSTKISPSDFEKTWVQRGNGGSKGARAERHLQMNASHLPRSDDVKKSS